MINSPKTIGIRKAGNTRAAVLHIAKEWGVKTTERALSIDELVDAAKNGSLKEMFGSGTAAIIAPVKKFCYQGREYQVADGTTGELSGRLYRYMLDLQYGRIDDPHGWREKIL